MFRKARLGYSMSIFMEPGVIAFLKLNYVFKAGVRSSKQIEPNHSLVNEQPETYDNYHLVRLT